MFFLAVAPALIVTPNETQESGVNLTPFIQKHYQNKVKERANPVVTVTNLTVPGGTVEGGVTYITPELILESTDAEAIKKFALSFFSDEETSIFKIERNKEYEAPAPDERNIEHDL